MKKVLVSASLMCADMMNMGKSLAELEAVGTDYLHIDVMDGSFVPNFALGTDFCRALKANSKLPLDVHLMINDPLYKFDKFPCEEGDVIAVHYESCVDVHRILCAIREKGAKAFLAINPATPIEIIRECMPVLDGALIMTVNPGFAGQKIFPGAFDKVERTRKLLDTADHEIILEVDGNVSFANIPRLTEAGADMIVVGSSSLFSKEGTMAENMAKMQSLYR